MRLAVIFAACFVATTVAWPGMKRSVTVDDDGNSHIGPDCTVGVRDCVEHNHETDSDALCGLLALCRRMAGSPSLDLVPTWHNHHHHLVRGSHPILRITCGQTRSAICLGLCGRKNPLSFFTVFSFVMSAIATVHG